MSDTVAFDFAVDKAAHTVTITREFDADLSLVWDAFTRADLLDQWLPPHPMTAKTRYQDFRVGGKRFYAMVTPAGEERWALQEYTAITPKTHFSLYNAFADKDENVELPGSEWNHTFSEQNGTTTVRITVYNESLERMERILEGFTAGMKMSLRNLDNLLATLTGR
ncbi:SRPBCC family protein [Hymenobacter properus]|uniref:SRPBCC domain-containing protein n=1 Tax=Hymenobacter properus TaxID=2791026 RepID=A0A931FNT3_9BACT|nr:SRPBCC domain-containing protein [Hymenobacter properus]MBF9144496.1 SRPBCC domain-containing protein [Hymenobacter properus]MBR7723314.1 SRPBCC domain-containing protein [Microvirga sp. SRT04]